MTKRKSVDAHRNTIGKIPRISNNGHRNKARDVVKKRALTKTFNKYAILSDIDSDDEMNVNLATLASKCKSPEKVKIPPIVTIDMKIDDIKKLLSDMEVVNFNLKYISLGIKIFCTSLNDFNKVCGKLNESKLKYFTHDVQGNKLAKFVLSGLPNMPIEDVKAGLTEAKINFTDVKMMRTKNENPNHALFLVYFASKSTTLQVLNQTKYILHVVIKWSTYVQARNGPTQCNNCQLYGHGVKNCHLPPKCAKCGRSHPTNSCTKDQQTDVAFTPTCCLCAQPHSSKSRDCPKRLEYIQMRMKQSKQQRESKPVPNNAQRNQSNTNFNPRFFTSKKVNSQQKYSDWFKSPNPNLQSSADKRSNSEQLSDELLSNEVLLKMMKELFVSLRSCRSKFDQLEAVTGIVLKYSTDVYNV